MPRKKTAATTKTPKKTKKDLPAKTTENLDTDLLSDAAPEDYIEPIPKQHGQLWLDTGKQKSSVRAGTWNFMGRSFEHLPICFLRGHMYRKLFEGKYDPKGSNRLVCMSWDGINAYGQAAQGWKPDTMRPHACGDIDSAGGLTMRCKMGKWHRDKDGKNTCLCPEKKRWLLLVYVAEDDRFLPAWFDAEGGHVKRWQNAYDRIVALRTNKNPVQRWMLELGVHRTEDGNYNPTFGSPSAMPDPDWNNAVPWIKEHGVQLFRESIESVKQRAFELANPKDQTD